MNTRRIVACLDVADGRVIKGVRFENHRDAGDILALARRYCRAGADELVVYDIAASPAGRCVESGWIQRLARVVNVPLCVAGGIKSVDDARAVLQAGADRVSVNSAALARPQLVNELIAALGRARVVVGIDSRPDGRGNWCVHQYTGSPDTSRKTALTTVDWVSELESRGAGEIVLNCMTHDGVGHGYDLEQLAAMRRHFSGRLVASGGAGQKRDFLSLFERTGADGALMAGALHRGEIHIGRLKQWLHQQGVAVALPAGAAP